MNETNGNRPPVRSAAVDRTRRQAGRFAVMVALIAIGLGLYWIYETFFRAEIYRVTLVPGEVSEGSSLVYSPAQLLDRMEYRLEVPGGPALDLEPTGEDHTWEFTVRREGRQLVKDNVFVGYLQWPGAEPKKLEISLGGLIADDGHRLRQTLDEVDCKAFQERPIEAIIQIRDRALSAPIGKLDLVCTDTWLEMDFAANGAWRVKMPSEEVIRMLYTQDDTFKINVELLHPHQDNDQGVLPIPVREFIHDENDVVIYVDFGVVPTLCPAPDPDRLEPASARADRWDGRLRVHGEDLDQTETAVLQRTGRDYPCTITSRASDRLELETSARLVAGTYTLQLQKKDCRPAAAGRLQLAAAGLEITPPRDLHMSQGGEVTLNWKRGSVTGPLVIEISRDGVEGSRGRLGEVAAEFSRFTPDLTSYEPGSYRILLRSETVGGVDPVSWSLEITPPERFEVLLFFKNPATSTGYWYDIKSAQINRRKILDSEWLGNPYQAKVVLAPGVYEWEVEDKKGIWYNGSFSVGPKNRIDGRDDYDVIEIERVAD